MPAVQCTHQAAKAVSVHILVCVCVRWSTAHQLISRGLSVSRPKGVAAGSKWQPRFHAIEWIYQICGGQTLPPQASSPSPL